MNKQELKSRIIARGEISGHAHIITGDAQVSQEKSETFVTIGPKGAVLRHLKEDSWMAGTEVWTEEHEDIDLSVLPGQVRHGDVMLDKVPGTDNKYKYIQQIEKDPYEDKIRETRD
jgi:hypothetical protein